MKKEKDLAVVDNILSVKAKEGKTETIVIPEGMSKLDASKQLKMQWEDEENIIELDRNFGNWHTSDVLVATKKVSEKVFGWLHGKSVFSFFGEKKPREISIDVGFDSEGRVQKEICFLGRFVSASWENANIDVVANRAGVTVTVEIKKKFRERVLEYFDKIEEHLKTNSIYKGKSVSVDTNGLNFIYNKGSENVILNKEEESIVDNFILKPLGKEGKRCMLFTGNYGTGKTETAIRIGKEGNKKGITFFYCKDPEQFTESLKMSINYQPCILFMEDIDSIGSGEERDQKINNMLNTLDGVETKGQSITTIFTTNHENRLNKALRRPGRIDLIVQFKNCNKETVEKIYKAYFQKLVGGNKLDYTLLAAVTPDVQGAVVAEIAKRAVNLMVNDGGSITNEMVEASIASIKHQVEFMNDNPEDSKPKQVKAIEMLVDYIGDVTMQKYEDIY